MRYPQRFTRAASLLPIPPLRRLKSARALLLLPAALTPAFARHAACAAATQYFTGTVNNANSTISLSDPATDYYFGRYGSDTAYVTGGSIVASNGAQMTIDYSTILDAVDLRTDLTFSAHNQTAVTLSHPPAFHGTHITFAPNTTGQEVDIGLGTVTGPLTASSDILTLGPDVDVHTGTTGGIVGQQRPPSLATVGLVNYGRISAQTPGQLLRLFGYGQLENHGTIEASNSSTLYAYAPTASGVIGTYAGTVSAHDAGTVMLFNNWTNTGTLAASAGGSLSLAGSWSNAGTVTAANATLTLGGAPAALGSIIVSNSTVNLATLLTTAQFRPIVLSGPGNSAGLMNTGNLNNVGDTLDLSQFPLTLTGGILTGGTVSAPGAQTLAVTGPASLQSVTVNAPVAVSSGANLTVTGSVLNRPTTVSPGGLLNLGPISAPAPVTPWTNTSTITASGATVNLNAAGTNTGTIALTNGSTLVARVIADTGTVTRQSASDTVLFAGTLDNTNATFDPNDTPLGPLLLTTCTVKNGTLASASPIQVLPAAAPNASRNGVIVTLNAVTLAAELDIPTNSKVTLVNGLTLSPGSDVLVAGHLIAPSTQTITGTGTITLDGGALENLHPQISVTLTLGPGVTVTSTAAGGTVGQSTSTAPRSLVNQGTISAVAPAATVTVPAGQTFANTGTLEARSSATLAVNTLANLSADGTLTGGTYAVYDAATLALPSAVTTNNATLLLSGPASQLPALAPLAANQGSLTLTAGRSFSTQAALTNTGSITLGPSSSLAVTGPLANPGTLSLASAATLTLFANAPDDVRQQLLAAHLTSPSADATHRLAYLFSGEPTAPTSVTVQLTLAGDANLDGKIDADDDALLDRGSATNGSYWWQGDFNYDGIVNDQDYLLIDSTFLRQQGGNPFPAFLALRESEFGPAYVSALLTSVPEPSSLACVLAAGSLLARRRSRR